MVVGAQLRRDAETRAPNLADLRESDDLEQDADVVPLLCDEDGGFAKRRDRGQAQHRGGAAQ